MSKLDDAEKFLYEIGMPKTQQTEICMLCLLAMAGIKPKDEWKDATNNWLRIHDVIAFINNCYDRSYAENTRETFRKQAMHHFRTAALIEDNGKATNSPHYRYRITLAALAVIRSIDTGNYQSQLNGFLMHHKKLMDIYASKRSSTTLSIRVNGGEVQFSTGKHNLLQKAIIEIFAPRFAPNSECLYVGDTSKKDLVKNVDILKELKINITLHDKMPDIVLYRRDRNWLYFIEAVSSVGPMDTKRILEISEMTKNASVGIIFVTAFLDIKTYKKFADKLAWETEVWIAEMPDHMIHLNGDRFLGPRRRRDD